MRDFAQENLAVFSNYIKSEDRVFSLESAPITELRDPARSSVCQGSRRSVTPKNH